MKHLVRPLLAVSVGALLILGAGCHRNVEDYSEEAVEAPDLSRIFPEGAQADASGAPGGAVQMPEPPPGTRGSAAARPAGAAGGAGTAGAVPGDDAEPMLGTVRVSDELASRIPPGATLFVFARTQPGMPPTAAKKIDGASFPLTFSLGPEDRMIAQFPFEGPFTINARIDADGNAMTRNPGDLQGSSEGHLPGEEGIEVLIDEVL